MLKHTDITPEPGHFGYTNVDRIRQIYHSITDRKQVKHRMPSNLTLQLKTRNDDYSTTANPVLLITDHLQVPQKRKAMGEPYLQSMHS